MTAPSHYLSTIFRSFSTFLKRQSLPAEQNLAAEAVLAEFIESKADLNQWEVAEVEQFLQYHPATDEIKQVISKFIQQQPPHQTSLYLREYLLALAEENCSSSTIRNYRSDINQFVRFAKENELKSLFTKPKLAEFAQYQLEKGLKESSITRKLSSICQFGLWADKVGVFDEAEPGQLHWLNEVRLENLVAESPVEIAAVEADTAQEDQTVRADQDSSAAEHVTLETEKAAQLQAKAQAKREKIRQEQAAASQAEKSDVEEVKVAPAAKQLQAANAEETTEAKVEKIYAKNHQSAVRPKSSPFLLWRWLLPYLNLGLILILAAGIGIFGYRQFFLEVPSQLAYPSQPTAPARVLSFQGRLTDQALNPVTSPTSMQFYLYDDETNSDNLLWDSLGCTVDPDQDGIFTVNLGDDCGGAIGEEVFTEYSNVWLEVKVGSEILAPRQPIRTVAYALNAETVQGYPIDASGSATVNTLLTMNSSGEVMLGEVSPKLRSVSGTFTLEGESLLLQTTSGSDGDIILDPDGLGEVISRAYLSAPGATLSATYAEGVPLKVVGGPVGTGNLTEWLNNAGSTVAVIDASGKLGLGGVTTPSDTLHIDGSLRLTGAFKDSANSAGSAGQLLTSTGAGVEWESISNISVGNADELDNLDSLQFLRSDTSDDFTSGTLGLNTGTILDIKSGATLDVNGDLAIADTDILFDGLSTNFNMTGDLSINTDDLFVEKTTGNVGIGTTSPKAILDIRGNIQQSFNNPTYTWTSGAMTFIGPSSSSVLRLRTNQVQALIALGLSNGSAAAPSLTFSTSDSDTTGLFRAGPNQIGISIAGNERIRIDNSGNVGIGTTSPNYLLDVAGDINTSTGTFRMAGVDYGQYFIDGAGLDGQVWTSDGTGRGVWETPVDEDNYVDSVSFNTTDGILTLGRTGALPDLTADLDGRYLTSFTETDPVWVAAEPNYFNLGQNEIVTGIPAFNGGTTGVSAPFTVDSTFLVSNLNADLLDGLSSADFLRANENDTFESGKTLTIAGDLDVNGDLAIADTDILFDGLSTNFNLTGDLSINTDDLFVEKTTGEVGIGTTTPGYLLDVAGDINTTTGTFRMAGTDYGQYFIDGAGTDGQVWTSDGTGRGVWETPVDEDNYVDSISFNTADGVLTVGRTGVLADLTADLDGRYLTSFTETDPVWVAAEPNYFNLTENETVTGIPDFNGGTTGVSAPFTVDSTFLVSNLNADLLDGQEGSYYMPASTDNWVNTTGDTMTGTLNFSGVASDITTATDEHLSLMPAGTGNVGIGTTSPGYKLDVAGTASVNSLNINDEYTFPTTDGTADYILKTDGNGVVSWADPASLGSQAQNIWATFTADTGTTTANTTTDTLSVVGAGSVSTAISGDTLTITGTDNDNYVDSVSFNTTDGILTLGRTGALPDLTADLDGRYLTSFTETDPVWVAAEPNYFNLTENETVTGIPDFNGGTTGVSAPFTVDSTFLVSNLNADLLDGQEGSYYMPASTDNWVNTTGDTMTGTLNFSGVASDITTATDEHLSLMPGGTGNVGIGTTTPGYKFTVVGGSTSLASAEWLYFGSAGTLYGSGSVTTLDAPNSGGSLRFNTQGSERMRLDKDGRLGIGTNAPTSKLHVSGAVTGKALAIFNETGNQDIIAASASGSTRFRVDNDGYVHTQRLVDLANNDYYVDPAASGTSITTAGDVGVGTTSPSDRLHVDGDMRVTGAFKDSGNSAGASGDILTSTTTGTDWVSPSTITVGNATNASDADKLDGLDSLDFLRSNTTDSYTSGTLSFAASTILDINAGATLDVNGDLTIADTDITFDGASTNFTTTGDFSINTSQLFVEKNTGNIGLGTSAPGAKLHLTTASGELLRLAYDTDTYHGVSLDASGLLTWTPTGNGAFALQGNAGGRSLFQIDQLGTGDIFTASSSGTTRFVINNSGNVGIGTADPQAKLDIAGTTSTISNTSGDITLDAASNQISFSGDSLVNLLNIEASGQIKPGAFTVNPTAIGAGSIIYRSDLNELHYYNGSSWNTLGSSLWTNSFNALHAAGSLANVADLLVGGSSTASAKFRVDATSGYVYSQRFVDKANSNYFIDPAATEISASLLGKVGIGTINPSALLDVDGTASVSALTIRGASPGYIDQINGNDLIFRTSPGGDAGLTNRLTLANSGNLGIGTTNPTSLLEIRNAVNDAVLGLRRIGTNTAGEYTGIHFSAADSSVQTDTFKKGGIFFGLNSSGWGRGNLYFSLDNNASSANADLSNAKMTLTSEGKLGIGTTSPGTKLHVNGSIRSDQYGDAGTIGNAAFVAWGAQNNDSSIVLGQQGVVNWRIRNTATTGALSFATAGAGTEKLTILTGGNVGIGTTAPQKSLHIEKDGFNNIIVRSTARHPDAKTVLGGLGIHHISMGVSSTNLYMHYTDDSNTVKYAWWNGTAIDLAEWYRVGSENLDLNNAHTLEKGQVLCIDESDNSKAVSCSATNNQILGIYSTAPWSTMGIGNDVDYVNDQDLVEVALAGRVPTIVTTKDGQIIRGDSITASDIMGVGGALTSANQTVGKALESTTDWSDQTCTPVNSINEINWPADDGTNPTKPCYRLPDGTIVGKIMVLVNVSFSDPDIYLTDSGEIELLSEATQLGTQSYSLAHAERGSINRIGAFAEAIIANLRAGLIEAAEITTDSLAVAGEITTDSLAVATNNLTVAGQSIQDLIDARINEYLASRNISIEDATTSAQLSQIQLGADQISTISGETEYAQLEIDDVTGQTVASFDSQGNATLLGELNAKQVTADNIEANDLRANEATISSISSNQIAADQITATSSRMEQLEAKMAELEAVRAQTAEFVNATISGTLYASQIEGLEDQLATSLNNPSLLDKLLGKKATATDSASIAQVFSLVEKSGYATDSATLANPALTSSNGDIALNASAAYIDDYFSVNGSGYIAQQLGVGENLLVGNSLAIGHNFIEYQPLTADEPQIFHIQPSGTGSLSLMAGLMVLNEEGHVLVDGNIAVAGDVEVGQTLLTSMIKPRQFSDPLQVQLATISGQLDGEVAGIATGSSIIQESRLEITNQDGDPTATISARGRGSFSGLNIASDDLTQASTQSAAISSDKTSGRATLRSGRASITINNSQISADSLIYISPLGSTQNQVLYIKSQAAEDPDTTITEGQFTVGFDQPINHDVAFNWWIVN